MPKYELIYEPKNRAREYAPGYAANLFEGCGNDCDYCYVKTFPWTNKATFASNPRPKDNVLEKLQRDIAKMLAFNDIKEVFLCFTCDPYQEIERKELITRRALEMLLENNIPVRILTKSNLAYRDLNLMAHHKDLVSFGMTLVFAKDADSKLHEPNAAYTSTRNLQLMEAHGRGIKTWVSLEPVWSPKDAFQLITQTHTYIDEYKIGKLNYHPQEKNVDWKKFAVNVSRLCEKLQCDYVLKEDLKKLL